MITFFRRIRKGLLGSGKTSKYLLYAIGEIALVVIGILIALQVNNWNEWRKDREKEYGILNELVETCKENRDKLKSGIVNMNGSNVSSKVVLSFLNDSIPYSDTLSYHFWRAGWPHRGTFNRLSRAGYERFKSVGLEIIENDVLRKEVISLFETRIPRVSTFAALTSSDFESNQEFIKRNF